MYTAVIGLIIFVAVLLILVVLVQNSKGGGLSSQFGAGSSQLMGVKKTGDLLEQLTWGLAIGLMVLTLSTSLLVPRNSAEGVNSVNIEKAPERSAAPSGLKAPGTAPAPATQPADSSK